jgi:2-polyprenyl-3-methyl-5-hydroxy-6-metoxy-1,4-benzoquinol methylase
MTDASHYLALAAAYARGVLRQPELDDAAAIGAAQAAGVRLHRFKRTSGLARVRRVIGALRGLAPARVLDIGSGRGAFLWPMLDELPELAVTAIDVLPHRAAGLGAVARGGVTRLTAARMDATALGLADRSVDVVTILEVLEHLPDPAPAAREAVRVARTAVIASAPSHEDDNPEHLRVFDGAALTALFLDAGARRVAIEHVLGHLIAIAMVAP